MGDISRITNGNGVSHPDRVSPKKDREREEQLDFAEEMEHRAHDHEPADESLLEDQEPLKPGISRGGTRPVGYRTDEEAGGGLDLTV